MKNMLKVIFVIIGTIIGAGFASGKEIYLFFMVYGTNGLWGIMLSGILTGLIIFAVLKIVRKTKSKSYQEFLNTITKGNKKSTIKQAFVSIMNMLINLFLLISFYIMIAGFSAYFQQEFNIPIYITSVIAGIACYITFRKNIEGIMKINTYLIPLLIIFVIHISLKNVDYVQQFFQNQDLFCIERGNWFLSSILYASYNSIILIPILITLTSYIKSEKQNLFVSMMTSICIILLAICVYTLLLRGSQYIDTLELPLVLIASEFGKGYRYIYGMVIIVSIFTSAISAGYGLLENLTQDKTKYAKIAAAMCASAVFVSGIGFTTLVNFLYPIFGILGIGQIYFILKNIGIHKNKIKWLQKQKKTGINE